jgi:hypothetical protein
MSATTRIPAAAPARVRSVLAAPDRAARVVHRGTDAVYLEVDGACLGILSTRATAVPCAVRTALPVLPEALLRSDVAWVGEGRLVLAGTEVVVARTVDVTVPRLGADRSAEAEQLLRECVAGRVDHVSDELPRAAVEALAGGDAAAVPALLGRGGGLTPVGDDVLAGWLATAAATDRLDEDEPVAAAVARLAPSSTTLLSATLLDCARRGEVIPEFRHLLLDLAGEEPTGLRGSVDALLGVGHTSGAGLLLGTLLALRHLASRSTP